MPLFCRVRDPAWSHHLFRVIWSWLSHLIWSGMLAVGSGRAGHPRGVRPYPGSAAPCTKGGQVWLPRLRGWCGGNPSRFTGRAESTMSLYLVLSLHFLILPCVSARGVPLRFSSHAHRHACPCSWVFSLSVVTFYRAFSLSVVTFHHKSHNSLSCSQH